MKKSHLVSVFLACVSLVSVARAMDPCPTPVLGSCLNAQAGQCSEIVGSNLPVDQFKADCENGGSTFSTSACSASGSLGSCVFSEGPASVVLSFYAPFPAAYVGMICGQMQATVCQK